MRRFQLLALVVVLGLIASASLVGGCNSDPHDTHMQTNVGAGR